MLLRLRLFISITRVNATNNKRNKENLSHKCSFYGLKEAKDASESYFKEEGINTIRFFPTHTVPTQNILHTLSYTFRYPTQNNSQLKYH